MLRSRQRGTAIAAHRAAVAADSPVETHRVAMQVSTNDATVFELALNNAVNFSREYSEVAQEVEVEIVACGPGLHMLRADTSPARARIQSVMQSVPGVAFTACGDTLAAMERDGGRGIELLPGVRVVRAGAVRLVALQEAGWRYLRA